MSNEITVITPEPGLLAIMSAVGLPNDLVEYPDPDEATGAEQVRIWMLAPCRVTSMLAIGGVLHDSECWWPRATWKEEFCRLAEQVPDTHWVTTVNLQ